MPSADPTNPFSSREFRAELSQMLDEKFADKLEPIARLLAAHDLRLQEQKREIEEHDRAIQRTKGAAWAFGLSWSAFITALELWLHRGR